MGPRKKRTCERSSFDRSRFLSEDGEIHFMNRFSKRAVVPERIVMYNELDDTDFAVWMRERKLFTLYDSGYRIVVNWVREFYANMFEVTDSLFKTFVRGHELEITPDFLSELLEIERVEGAHFPILGNRKINYNRVANTLTGKPIAWTGADISHHKLSDSYRLLSIFIRHNVCPKISKRVTKEDGYLLYYIGTQRKVNVPLAVYRGMARVHTAPHNTALPFPCLVSKMLVDMGKLAEPNEDIIIPKQKIDYLTLEKSKSHIPSVELDDDNDEDMGDPAGADLLVLNGFRQNFLYIANLANVVLNASRLPNTLPFHISCGESSWVGVESNSSAASIVSLIIDAFVNSGTACTVTGTVTSGSTYSDSL